MLFAGIFKSIFKIKNYIISSINNENRLKIKLFFFDLVLSPMGPFEGKIVVFNKMSHKD